MIMQYAVKLTSLFSENLNNLMTSRQFMCDTFTACCIQMMYIFFNLLFQVKLLFTDYDYHGVINNLGVLFSIAFTFILLNT